MKKKEQKMMTALAYILIGALFCILRSGLLGWLMTAVGVILVVLAVMDAMKKEYVSAIIKGVVGIVIALGGWLFVGIVLLVLGVVVLIKGVQELLKAIKDKETKALIGAIITIVFGAMLIASKFAMMDILFIVIGVLIALDGVLMLLGKK